MTLAITAAPLNSERRDTSVSGTRAVVSSQQLMKASNYRRGGRPVRFPPLTLCRVAARLDAADDAVCCAVITRIGTLGSTCPCWHVLRSVAANMPAIAL